MVIDATSSTTTTSILKWYVNNVVNTKLTTTSGIANLVEGDAVKLEIVGNNNTSIVEYIIPTLVCNVTYSEVNFTLTFDFTGSVFANNYPLNLDYINIYLTLTQDVITLDIMNQFQIIQFNTNPVFVWDLTNEVFNKNMDFNISFNVIEHFTRQNSPLFSDVASPTVITQTITVNSGN